MLIYIGIAFLIGAISGVIHVLIIFRRVLPYMKKRGYKFDGLQGAYQINKAVAEYLKLDDPEEKKIKLIIQCLKIPFIISFLIVAFCIYAAAQVDI